jgi:hypothetical protein
MFHKFECFRSAWHNQIATGENLIGWKAINLGPITFLPALVPASSRRLNGQELFSFRYSVGETRQNRLKARVK